VLYWGMVGEGAMRGSLLALLLALLARPPGAAAEALRCVSLEYSPLIQKDADGAVRGLAVDVVAAVFKRMGHSVSVEVLPWARSLALVRLGERDCVFTIFHSNERAQFLDFSRESIIPQIIYFYARRDGSVSFDGDLRSLGRRTVGTVLKVNYGARFEAARAALALQEVASLEQNFRKLVLGRIDVTPGVAAQIVQLPLAVDSVPSYIAFAKNRHLTALRDQFDVELRAFVASGAYRRLLEQYHIGLTPELARFLEAK
jgi:polar amino acid transport system substrate-binding protein